MPIDTPTMSPSTGHQHGQVGHDSGSSRLSQQGSGKGKQEHREGPVARQIEQYTAQIPSDVYLWAAGASIAGSLVLAMTGNKHGSLFVGQWAPTLLILGLYNKVVKVAGSDSQS